MNGIQITDVTTIFTDLAGADHNYLAVKPTIDADRAIVIFNDKI